MQPILYRPFLLWSRNHPTELKIVGDAGAKFDRSDDMVYRWAQLRAIGDATARHLDHLMTQVEGDGADIASIENEILETVNAPIETGADVQRETRDQCWLQRSHATLCLVTSLLSCGAGAGRGPPADETPAAEAAEAPAPETVPVTAE